MYAVSEADWGRESLKAFAFLVNTGKDGTFSLPQSLRDSSLIRGSLVRSQQPSERKRSFTLLEALRGPIPRHIPKGKRSGMGFFTHTREASVRGGMSAFVSNFSANAELSQKNNPNLSSHGRAGSDC